MTTMDRFTRSWRRAWNGAGAKGDGVAWRDALLRCYAEAHRHYHTLQHLDECLAGFEAVAEQAQQPSQLELALWFHDAIYDVRSKRNEEASADWAREVLRGAGVSEEAAGRVHALVLVTRHDGVPQDADARLLVDIDLSILGAERARFEEYEHQIRAEYAHVPGLLFRFKRGQILRAFLDRPWIYATECFRARLERPARENLARALGLASR
ncbi:MAG: N-methyl-D-aspartate receptor NMDAR2C subunit [Rhodanobacteraceae bacterium]|nr:N-methyl-D-aspartate receptor NMDAR2C subunit [Rhodanobacteraceae bacterium]